MYYFEYEGINSFIIGMSKVLLDSGVPRITRGSEAIELPNPAIIKIKNPLARLVTVPERKWNHTLAYAEALWIASGRNDMEMIGHYLQRMYDFSDDQVSMRAGYGPRLRYFTGVTDDYKIDLLVKKAKQNNHNIKIVDQYSFIEKIFAKDPFTRQAIITITDPSKDLLGDGESLKQTKDFPCTNNIQFILQNGKLDAITNMRSNDFFWGASAVNIFNYTFIQEYIAQILGFPIGNYYHVVNNLHYYKPFEETIKVLASINSWDDSSHTYNKTFNTLHEFDMLRGQLEEFENKLRSGKSRKLLTFGDEFFDDWAKVIYAYHTLDDSLEFANSNLTVLNKFRVLQKKAHAL